MVTNEEGGNRCGHRRGWLAEGGEWWIEEACQRRTVEADHREVFRNGCTPCLGRRDDPHGHQVVAADDARDAPFEQRCGASPAALDGPGCLGDERCIEGDVECHETFAISGNELARRRISGWANHETDPLMSQGTKMPNSSRGGLHDVDANRRQGRLVCEAVHENDGNAPGHELLVGGISDTGECVPAVDDHDSRRMLGSKEVQEVLFVDRLGGG